MGIAISAMKARANAQAILAIKELEEFERLAETKFKSVFSAIRAKMNQGEMYVPAVGVAAKDMDDFKEVMSYYGYIVQCQSGQGNGGDWTAVYSIWFNK